MRDLETNCMFNTLITVYHEGVSKFIPKLTLSEKKISTRKNPKWSNKNIKRLTNLKYKWFIRTQIYSKNESTKAVYNSVCRLVEKERINKDHVMSLKESSGNFVTDKLIISNIFNKQFQTPFSRDDGRPLSKMDKRTNCVCKIDLSVFSNSNFLKYLLNLDVHKAPGVDGMHPNFRKIFEIIFNWVMIRLNPRFMC
ncbi:RNA-directed DNA polymerase from mobile element jockey [Brachionus plicatilis]|uniref:RNA-directed DNA polymerase from mobile element jockey n=1 Tax=Brachionus plicatilis TaxID=10195 RepID=A0A3M7RQU8_BRAPC|nr:RNA-directed DNA polymerase from mobile element jockey [Brachionus plicatilis]